jgi:hypothetical protein
MSQQINLFDPSLQKQVELVTTSNVAIASLAIFSIVVLWAGWAHWHSRQLGAESAVLQSQVTDAQAETKSLAEKLANLKPDSRLQQELSNARNILSTRREVLAVLQKGLGPEAANQADILSGFARQAPKGLWLTGFTVNADNGSLEIRGRTTDPALIPEYVRRLSNERAFAGRTFAALEIQNGALAPATPANGSAGTMAVSASAPPAPGTTATARGPAAAPNNFHEFVLQSTVSATPLTGPTAGTRL